MTPKISVIVPVYNTERFLRKCIQSVINQTFNDWELLAINDCSPDNSAVVLADLASKDSRIKVINHSVNQGISKTRFTGLQHMKGTYVTFLDSDDWIPRNTLQIFYDKIEKEEADIVIGSMVKVIDRWSLFRSKPSNSPTPGFRTESITMPELFDKYFINFFGVNLIPSYMCGKLYRKSSLDKAPLAPPPFSLFEDMLFNLMLHPFITKISFVTDTVYYYRYGGGTSRSMPKFLESIKAQYIIKEEYIERYNYTVACPFIRYELINCFYTHFKNLILLDKLSSERVEKLIEEELKDHFYEQNLFEGIDLAERSLVIKNKDIPGIMRFIHSELKKERMRHQIKRCIAKILK